jgi:hypothetical protein
MNPTGLRTVRDTTKTQRQASLERKTSVSATKAAKVRKSKSAMTTSPTHATEKMATGGEACEVTTAELKTLIMNLQTSQNNNFQSISTTLSELTDRVKVTEEQTAKHEQELKDITESLNELSDINIEAIAASISQIMGRLECLEKAELENAVHSRKYNLMIHGIDGKESDNDITEEKIRKLAQNELGLSESYSKSVMIANCHRLPKKSNSWGYAANSDPIVVKFVRWADREAFLRGARNLRKDSRIRIRTHLPAELAKAKAKLSTIAYNKRLEGTHARIRERGATVTMDVRDGPGGSWKTVETISADSIVAKRLE